MYAYVADSMRKMQLRKSFSEVEAYAVGRYCSVERDWWSYMYKPSSAYITKNVTILRHHAEVLEVMVLYIQQIIFLKLFCFLDHD